MQNGSLVTVIGGSGFIGRHIVRALAKRGYRIRVACRRPDLAVHLQPLGSVGQIMPVQANVRYPNSLEIACDGADAVVYLPALLAPSGAQSFEAVHVAGARAAAAAARSAGARHYLLMSAIGAHPQAVSKYAQTKGEGEVQTLDQFPDARIIRPSIVFGPEDGFFNRFAALARISPFLPLIGGGHTKFQPVFVGDVAEATAKLLDRPGNGHQIYEMGGPSTFSFKELMEFTLKTIGRKRLLLSLAFPIAKLQGALFELLPNPLITRDQVELLKSDNVVSQSAIDEHRTLEGLGITPESIEAIVPSYLYRYRKAGQFTSLKVL